MDAQLKQKIESLYFAEYFYKTRESFAGVVGLIITGEAMLASGLSTTFVILAGIVGVAAPPVLVATAVFCGIGAAVSWFATRLITEGKALKALDRDVENGSLVKRYQEHLSKSAAVLEADRVGLDAALLSAKNSFTAAAEAPKDHKLEKTQPTIKNDLKP